MTRPYLGEHTVEIRKTTLGYAVRERTGVLVTQDPLFRFTRRGARRTAARLLARHARALKNAKEIEIWEYRP